MPRLEMVLCITTGFLLPIQLETLHFPMKRVVLHFWQNRPLLLQQQCLQVKSTLPGSIIRRLRQGTRLNERKRRLALIRRLPRWVQMYEAIVIEMDLTLAQDIITESELPMGRLIPITRTNRLL